MKHIAITFFLFLIAGCQVTPFVYNPEGHPIDSLVHIKAGESKWNYSTSIHEIKNATGTEIVSGRNVGVKNIDRGEMYLEPGEYAFTIRCADAIAYQEFYVSRSFVAGDTFEFSCNMVYEDDGGILGSRRIGYSLSVAHISGDSRVTALID